VTFRRNLQTGPLSAVTGYHQSLKMDHTDWNFGGYREHNPDHGGRSFSRRDAPTCNDKLALRPAARSCVFKTVAARLFRLHIEFGWIGPIDTPYDWSEETL